MSEADKDAPEKSVQDFLQRWSRRKLGIAEADDAAASAPAEPPATGESQSVPPPPAEASSGIPAAFDLASLPPIESIDAATDIRAFLAPGVPVELTRAALRRAWTSDPAIRDFIGIAENQWDFTNPDAVPGFGALNFKEEQVRAMVSRLFGETPAETPERSAVKSDPSIAGGAEPVIESPGMADRKAQAADTSVARASLGGGGPDDHAALQNGPDSEEEREPAQRKHGAALPK
jgi:hypothetical protein